MVDMRPATQSAWATRTTAGTTKTIPTLLDEEYFAPDSYSLQVVQQAVYHPVVDEIDRAQEQRVAEMNDELVELRRDMEMRREMEEIRVSFERACNESNESKYSNFSKALKDEFEEEKKDELASVVDVIGKNVDT